MCTEDDDEGFEQTEEYAIWTPRSWSDNDSAPPSSTAGKSTTEFSKPLHHQAVQEVPKDLLDVIERQDAVIERLVTWCQNLEDRAVTHGMKLVEHEVHKEENSCFRSSLKSELANLKASARRKAKEHSVEANVLYDKMQTKVDSRIAAWCSRHEGISNRTAPTSRASPRPKAASPQTVGQKATKQPAALQAPSSRNTPGISTPSKSRVQSSPMKGCFSPSAQTAAVSPTKRTSPASPRQQAVSPPRSGGRAPGSSTLGGGHVASGPSLSDRCLASSGHAASGPSLSADRCFERSASPDATRRSKRPPGQQSPPRSGKRALQNTTLSSSATELPSGSPLSSFGSLSYEVQNAIRQAASSPRSSFGRAGGTGTAMGLAAHSRASLGELGTPSRQGPARKALDGPSRMSPRPVVTSPGKSPCSLGASRSAVRASQAAASQAGTSPTNGTGQTFRFVARSVSPPAERQAAQRQPASFADKFERTVSPNTGRHTSPTSGRQGSPTSARQGSPTTARQGSPTSIRQGSPSTMRQPRRPTAASAASPNKLGITIGVRQQSRSPPPGSCMGLGGPVAQSTPHRPGQSTNSPQNSFAPPTMKIVPLPAASPQGMVGLAIRHPSMTALADAPAVSSPSKGARTPACGSSPSVGGSSLLAPRAVERMVSGTFPEATVDYLLSGPPRMSFTPMTPQPPPPVLRSGGCPGSPDEAYSPYGESSRGSLTMSNNKVPAWQAELEAAGL